MVGVQDSVCYSLKKIELIEKKKITFRCAFNEWAIIQYELLQQQIEFLENYTETGVSIQAQVQIHQIEPLKLKLQDITRGREQLKLIEDQTDDA